ncbi:hypothetical protein CH063_02819 [Colletotrichum higginsianum]|uniref:Uncharacterized protein n=2 Tax=Colletotrichum higginsianum TaxID=80884 RepID=H1VQ94_COLHI|nr:hypothetical protein CH63R_04084 [Colletotrichum higginsianum IMI 349063]OBR11788.1 hypothetical protein CH63R_04084 [Colletotrichum higginsianum IMI 349063]TIC99928.1 hypothetical protein CH35J_006048 [Colletotrichum higginsianum]CCF42400.1 hypothetical protein CH063_02819 [Colletotrichum higginsianum]
MTRLGPLTAQALGRSPYDDVVDGEGEDDPHAPIQQYDNRGRPVNPETKRMNRDMVRSHNEVMQVIGVAEPDNTPSSAEVDSVRRYFNYEDAVGTRLLRFGRALEIAGVWGINGMRLRILLYKRYADISFFELLQHERKQRSLSGALLTGLPTFIGGHVFKMATYWFYPFPRKNRYINTTLSYIRVHLQLYVFLQRLDIIPSSSWFPPLSFFIPGSPSSPVAAPAPPDDFSAHSLVQYAGAWCVNAIPFVSYVIWGQIWTEVTGHLWQEFYGRLPNTVHHRKPTPPPPPPPAPIPETPEPVPDVDRSQPGPLSEVAHEEIPEDSPPEAEPIEPLVQAARRPSAFSTRGDDYGSDDEEDGGVSATLISFDVEATDSTDAPPGLWSAELRPSTGPEGSGHGASVQYMDTMLTRLPACLASDIFTVISGYILVSPYEAVALRLVARSYRERMGLPTFDIHDTNIFSGMTMRGVTNFLGLEFMHLVIAGELWALVTGLAQWFHLTEEEWKLFNEIEETEAAEERRRQAQA